MQHPRQLTIWLISRRRRTVENRAKTASSKEIARFPKMMQQQLRRRAFRAAASTAAQRSVPGGHRLGIDWARVGLRRGFYDRLLTPAFPAMVGDVEGQFQPAPHTQLVENNAQVVLDHLLGGADVLADFPVGHAFPDQSGNFDFPWG